MHLNGIWRACPRVYALLQRSRCHCFYVISSLSVMTAYITGLPSKFEERSIASPVTPRPFPYSMSTKKPRAPLLILGAWQPLTLLLRIVPPRSVNRHQLIRHRVIITWRRIIRNISRAWLNMIRCPLRLRCLRPSWKGWRWT